MTSVENRVSDGLVPADLEKQPALNARAASADESTTTPTTTTTSIDPKAEARLLWKCDLQLIPILFGLYALSFLDRINIGNARIQGLQQELRCSDSQYNVALLIFFVPYILLEVPSNIILKKVNPSTWLATLMVCWGIATMCLGFVTNAAGLIGVRFVLGVFEAGVFPGCAYLISMYYKRHELHKRWSVFFCSGLVAGAFGGLLAFALVKMNGLGGYSGWRWIFIIEGLATIAYGFVAKFVIPDWPDTARFLNESEKALLSQRLASDGATGVARMDRLDKLAVKHILTDWKIWVGSFMYMGIAVSGYSSAFFIPSILLNFGWVASDAQLFTIPIYAVSVVTTVTASWLSDRLRRRYVVLMSGVLLATIGYIILLCQGPARAGLPRGARYMAVFFVVSGIYITQPLIIVWLSNNMSGHYKRAFGPAMQIGIGNIGGIIGSNIYLQSEAMTGYKTGYGTALGMLMFCAIMATIFYFGLMYENRRRDRGERDDRYQLPKEVLENLGDGHPEFRFSG